MKAPSEAQSFKLARQVGFARAMRSEPTASECALWGALSGSKLGAGFRRQATGIVDFLAPSRKLVVEVDGDYHRRAARRRAEARRDRRLERAGFRVLRLSAELVLSDVQAAIRLVHAALASLDGARRPSIRTAALPAAPRGTPRERLR